jgi:hypothetical protein
LLPPLLPLPFLFMYNTAEDVEVVEGAFNGANAKASQEGAFDDANRNKTVAVAVAVAVAALITVLLRLLLLVVLVKDSILR